MEISKIKYSRRKIGEYLKQVRERKDLTKYAVAQISGLQIRIINSIEDGSSSYTMDSFMKLINALGLHLTIQKSKQTIKQN